MASRVCWRPMSGTGTIPAMGVLFDYFAADSDEAAAAVADRFGGPGSREVLGAAPAPPKRGLFGRRPTPPLPPVVTDPTLPVYDTVALKGIDPVVQLGRLESLLTGRAYDDVAVDPRCGHALAVRDGGDRVVCTLTDTVVAALAEASPEAIARVVGPWSRAEEFWGRADPAELATDLGYLAGLARRATADRLRLYCWISA